MLHLIAERKIVEALERGELANLPGEGRPLELDDDALVPEDLRLAYRILKNAGFPAGKTELGSTTDALKGIKFEATKPGAR